MDNHPKKNKTKAYLQIGLIVGQVNVIEVLINQIIADNYINHDSDKNLSFSTDILQSGMIRLDDKLKLLENISKEYKMPFDRKTLEDLKKWRITRNIVAHGLPMHHTYDNNVSMLFKGEMHDLGKLRKGFAVRQDRIMSELRKLSTASVGQ